MNMYQIGPCTENDMYRNGSCYVLNWTLYQSGCSVPKKTYQKTVLKLDCTENDMYRMGPTPLKLLGV